MSFLKKLQININKVAEGYFANWTPEMPVSVGDYGDINGYRFTRDGNISRYRLNLKIERIRKETASFEKKDGLIVKTQASAESGLGSGNVKLDLQFGEAGSFLYHLRDITNIQFQERRDAFEKIGQLLLSGRIKWKDDYVLVVEVKQAGKAFILVAEGDNVSLQLECNSDIVGNLNLADVAGRVGYVRDSDSVIRYEVSEAISPLYRVVSFAESPPDGGGKLPLGGLVEKIRMWFSDKMPLPETIYLTEYFDRGHSVAGTFTLPNGETVGLCQTVEDAAGFISKSENGDLATLGIAELEVVSVLLNAGQMYDE
ncbi:hypothetical protein [Chromobacterium sphagni]|nr:hypothetical protein [Chromobacterium sphagni]